jgi:hypothetical protein
MKDLSVIGKFPEVLGAALSDPGGALLEAVGAIDGEVAAAVHAFSVRSLCQAGDLVGIGSFQRASIVSPSRICVITLEGESVLGVYLDPAKPLATVEKKLQDISVK